MIKVKSINDRFEPEDGYRILLNPVETKSGIDLELVEISPSEELNSWCAKNKSKWAEFKDKYEKELAAKVGLLEVIRKIEAGKGTVTLVHCDNDVERSFVTILLEALEKR